MRNKEIYEKAIKSKNKEVYKTTAKSKNGVVLHLTTTVIILSESERSEEQKQAIKELKESLFDFEFAVSEMEI